MSNITIHVSEEEREMLKEGLMLLWEKRKANRSESDQKEYEDSMVQITNLEFKI